jgi:hypothetical protein
MDIEVTRAFHTTEFKFFIRLYYMQVELLPKSYTYIEKNNKGAKIIDMIWVITTKSRSFMSKRKRKH